MKLFGIAAVVFAALFVFTVSTYAADEAAAVTVAGKVSVVKSDAGAVTAVTVTTAEGVAYKVAGEMMKKVAERDGKMVQVTGTVAEVEGQKVITVKSVKDVAPVVHHGE